MVGHLAEIEKAAVPLIQGQPVWIILAALLQLFYYAVFAAMFRAAFHTVDIESRIRDLLPVTLGALFVNVVAPTWGMAGAALFVENASHRGQPPARAAAGTLLAQTADFSAFALVLAAGIAYLSLKNKLQSYEIAATVFLIVLLCSLAFFLVLGLWRPLLLRRALGLLQSAMDRLAKLAHRSAFLPEGWAAGNAADFSHAAAAIRSHPQRLAATLAIALAAHLINIASLYSLFAAFHQTIELGPLVAGYAMGILFWNVSPVPQGVGVVEGMMALVFTSLGVSGIMAVLIVLSFRALNFWLPMLIGFVLLRRNI